MGDPFADLLTQFKGDKLRPQKEDGDVPAGALHPSTNLGFVTNQPKDGERLGSAPDVHTSDKNGNIGHDCEDLLGSMSNVNQVQTAPKTAIQDEFDTAFDLLQMSPSKSDFLVEHEPKAELDRMAKTKQELVVDEVRDMEVARLMYLGLSIDGANAYYEKGILYEDVMEDRKKKKQQKRQMQRQLAQAEWDREDPISPEGRKTRESSVDLFSIAAGILNKGKRLVDQITIFPDGEGQFTEEQKSRQRQSPHGQPPPRPGRKTYSRKKDLKFLQPPQGQLVEGDLLSDFEEKLTLDKDKNSSTSLVVPSQDEGTLLDFDDQPAEPDIKLTSPVSTVPVSEVELSGYNEFKERATELFRNGDYVAALQEFEKSANTLPQLHPLRIISYSNLIASQLKTGQYKECLHISEIALSLFPEDVAQWSQVIQNSEPVRTYRDMWPKIALRRAEAFEHSENYKDAFAAYQALVEKNFCTDKVLDGKRRCQKVLRPEKPKAAKETSLRSVVSQQRDKHYEHLEKVKEDNRKQAEIETQKDALYDQVHEQIESWKAGKPEDIRHLLCNLQMVIAWSNWTAVPPPNLVLPKRVKLTYLKAIAKTHPDKIPASLPLEQRMVAESVFSTLAVAWEKFKNENSIN